MYRFFAAVAEEHRETFLKLHHRRITAVFAGQCLAKVDHALFRCLVRFECGSGLFVAVVGSSDLLFRDKAWCVPGDRAADEN